MAPGGRYTNQIYHVLVDKLYGKIIKNVRSYRGAGLNCVHIIFRADMKIRKAKKIIRRQERIGNRKELQKREIQEKYQEEILKGY